MNILTLTTGGTIGSAFDGDAIDVRRDGRCAVAERYASAHPDVQFDIKSPLNILSERIGADDFNTLAKALYDADHHAYDGMIVTSGSDALAYIAAFIGLLCGNCGMPVCVVASDKVLSDPAANGCDNFACAVELIRQRTGGVFVPYRNSDGVMHVHAATDLRQADLSDDFVSFHGAYGVFDNGVLRECRPYIAQTVPDVFGRENPPCLSDSVLLLHPYPMQDYAALKADGKRAVLHTLYHSATVDTRLIEWMKESGAPPVYLASLRSGRSLYASTSEVIKAGAIPLFDIAPECAYMKLLLACSQDKMSIREFMEGSASLW